MTKFLLWIGSENSSVTISLSNVIFLRSWPMLLSPCKIGPRVKVPCDEGVPRVTAKFNQFLRSLVIGAASRGPLALLVEVPWRCESRSRVLLVEVPCAASRGPMWRCESRSLGTKLKPKNCEFGSFIDPSDQNQLYHTPLLSKIWDLNDRKKLVNNPFKAPRVSALVLALAF